MRYKVFVKNPTTNEIWEFPFSSIKYTEELNKDRDATFVFDPVSLQPTLEKTRQTLDFVLSATKREIYVTKDDTTIYYGLVTDQGDTKDQSGAYSVAVASTGFFSILYKAIAGIPSTFYTTQDAKDIAWDLINTYQNSDTPYSDYGITRGLNPSSTKDRQRTFKFKRINEAIEGLSNLNLEDGFDFEINNSKQFDVYYPQKGQNRPNIVLQDGHNILTWSLTKPLISSMANKVYVIGSGENDDLLYSTRESADTYKTSFGLLEEKLSERDIETTDTLNDKGDKYLSLNQSPIRTLVVTTTGDSPEIIDYQVGDSLKVQIASKNIDSFMRVHKRTVEINPSGATSVTLTLR